MSNTKTPTDLAPRLTDRETKIADAEKAVVEARDTLWQRRQGLLDAKARVEKIARSWRAGKTDFTATDKIEAEAEVEMWEALIPPAERAVKASELKRKSLTPVLAEAVAKALGDSIYGVEAEVALAAPVKGTDTPKVYVRETRAHEMHEWNGTVKGDVEVIVTGPAYLAAFDRAEVKQTLRAAGMTFPPGEDVQHTRKRQDGIFATGFRIASAMPLMPIIPRVSENYVKWLNSAEEIRSFAGDRAQGGSRAVKVSENIEDGIRRVVVDVSLVFRPIGASRDMLIQQARDYLGRKFAVGKGKAGVGMIEDLSVREDDGGTILAHGREWPATKVTARLVFVSKVAAR